MAESSALPCPHSTRHVRVVRTASAVLEGVVIPIGDGGRRNPAKRDPATVSVTQASPPG